jgi:hypothetical protein
MYSCNCLDNLKYIQNLATLFPFKYLIQNSGIFLKEFNINTDLFLFRAQIENDTKTEFLPR